MHYNHSVFNDQITDEELAHIWTLNPSEAVFINKHQFQYKLHVAIQLCSLRKYGRFLDEHEGISTKVLNYLASQIGQGASFKINVPDREKTYTKQCQEIIQHLGFKRPSLEEQEALSSWLLEKSEDEVRRDFLIEMAEKRLLDQKIVLPTRKVLKRLVRTILNQTSQEWFSLIYQKISDQTKEHLDLLTWTTPEEPKSLFAELKDSPPAAAIGSINLYLDKFEKLKKLEDCEVDFVDIPLNFIKHSHELAKRYDAWEIKRFPSEKRYSLLSIFLSESQKTLLDSLVLMHDQFIQKMLRETKNVYEKQQRLYRKKSRASLNGILSFLDAFIDCEGKTSDGIFDSFSKDALQKDIKNVRFHRDLEERGVIEILSRRYRGIRRYFPRFLNLPFEVESGNEDLLIGIDLIRKLDKEDAKKFPSTAPISFIDFKLQKGLYREDGSLRRGVWEIGLAIAIKDKFRSGDIYLPQSKRHTSFWNLIYSEKKWEQEKDKACKELHFEANGEIETKKFADLFEASLTQSQRRFKGNKFAKIEKGKLKLKKDAKLERLPKVDLLQNAINASLPRIRIEDLIVEVDKELRFSQYFTPIQGSRQETPYSYKSIIAAIISMATNLGIIAMSNSTEELSVDILRDVVRTCIREETIKAANAEIVNAHTKLSLSSYYGSGELSSSDGQRFRVRGSSLLASYYPRYFGYYEKGVSIYTHVSDQSSVFGTKVISCSPREALYVIDGLLENDTILGIKEHTTDTEGYTEHIFALCRLLGYKFMPRIKNLKDQTLYRIDKNKDYGEIDALLRKTVDMELIKEQWEPMLRVVASLRKKLTPAHIIIQRLANTSPADRLSKAFTHLGRLEKTQYILDYVTDPLLRRKAHVQLNKGEYRHKLPRWVFFANQGEFQTGDYEEMMNKASCLSLVSNTILYWNTKKIGGIIDHLRSQGEEISEETISRISLLPYKHVIPNGTYFSERGGMKWGSHV